ncbi:hypothetical protein SMF913_28930 [Streptomyces malaysiensis]|uniref:Uncharacterized protein n=1 Tax=Streptomyces malaysiensis TaxID=92644 RepID=A0A2J7YZL5_STRMQ|nr:hypothetical protein SMF913_28930 [Streptomyces malaysiensis]
MLQTDKLHHTRDRQTPEDIRNAPLRIAFA